jgi:hypothetical protein
MPQAGFLIRSDMPKAESDAKAMLGKHCRSELYSAANVKQAADGLASRQLETESDRDPLSVGGMTAHPS